MIRRFLVLVSLFALPAFAEIPPAPAKHVTDHANAIIETREAELNAKLAEFERETSNQVLVYVARKLPAGQSIETFATEAFNAWGVGQAGKNNGVVLFLFIEDRESRIEAGTGLEPLLTKTLAKDTIIGVELL